MPRTPTYGRAAGPGDAVGSSIYELYAPQRESTKFGVDFAKTGYEFQKEVELEKQRQLDAQIAQSQRVQNIQEQAADKARRKQRKGKKVSSAAAWGTAGAKYGAAGGVPGSIVGGIIGGLGGWLFGEEGGMVPYIHPNSLLYKQYQAGGDVTGYSGGQPKFLRRGYQNLQFRQEDVNRAQENLDKMKSYGTWDAILDIGKGYMAGKELAPKKYTDMAKILGSGIGKEGGLTRAWDIITGKALEGPKIPEILQIGKTGIEGPSLSDAKSTYLAEVMKKREGMDIGAELEAWKKKAAAVVKKPTTPARKTTYRGSRNPFRKRTKPKPQSSMVQDLLMSGSLGGLSGASGPR